jgi:hypothetical protein
MYWEDFMTEQKAGDIEVVNAKLYLVCLAEAIRYCQLCLDECCGRNLKIAG